MFKYNWKKAKPRRKPVELPKEPRLINGQLVMVSVCPPKDAYGSHPTVAIPAVLMQHLRSAAAKKERQRQQKIAKHNRVTSLRRVPASDGRQQENP